MRDLKREIQDKVLLLFSNKIFLFIVFVIIAYFAAAFLFVVGVIALQVIIVLAVLLAVGVGIMYLKEKFTGR